MCVCLCGTAELALWSVFLMWLMTGRLHELFGIFKNDV